MDRYNVFKGSARVLASLGFLLGVCFLLNALFNQDKSKQGWSTFTSNEFGFEFDYPSTWKVGFASHAPDSHCPLITLAPEWSPKMNVWGDSGRAIAIFREPNLGPDKAFWSEMELSFSYDVTGDLSDFSADNQQGDLRHGTTRVFYTYYKGHNIHYGVIRKRFGSQSLEMYVQIASSTPEHVSEATSTLQTIGRSVRLTNTFAGLKNECFSNQSASLVH